MILGLVGDIAACVGPYIKNILNAPWVERLIVILKSDLADEEAREIAEWALEQIKNAISAKV
jgi:hypothetical protein